MPFLVIQETAFFLMTIVGNVKKLPKLLAMYRLICNFVMLLRNDYGET